MAERTRQRQPAAPAQSELGPEGFQAKNTWVGQEQVPVLWANQVFLTEQQGQFLLSFGRSELPYEIPRMTRQTVDRLQREGVPIIAVARVAISPEQMGAMLNVMNDYYRRWVEAMQQRLASSPAANQPSPAAKGE